MKDFLLSVKAQLKRAKLQLPKNKKDSIFKLSNLYFLLPVFLLLVLISLFFFQTYLKFKAETEKLYYLPFSVKTHPYPVLNTSLNKAYVSEQISAKSAIIVDADSKVIIFSKDEKTPLPMASTTKIMTAITALDYFKPGDVLTIKTNNISGSAVKFKKGEKFLLMDLLYAMMLPSSNDAAKAIAENYETGERAFIDKMNENALRFNLLKTHFADSIGLNDQENYSTPFDLARLTSIALKNDIFAQIVSTKNKEIIDLNKNDVYDLYNLNKLLGQNGINGVKTGFTEEAQGVLVTSKSYNGHTLIIVVMKSKDRFLDTQMLLDFIEGNIEYKEF